MSAWLSRALKQAHSATPVPNVPDVPKQPETADLGQSEGCFGSFGTFGTATPISAEKDGLVYSRPLERAKGEISPLGFALLSPDRDPCPGFRRWPKVHAAIQHFLDVHAAQAEAFGWSEIELFGVHPIVGATRVDHCGALMLGHDRVVAVAADAIGFANGLVCRRRPVPVDAVLIWNFGKG